MVSCAVKACKDENEDLKNLSTAIKLGYDLADKPLQNWVLQSRKAMMAEKKGQVNVCNC